MKKHVYHCAYTVSECAFEAESAQSLDLKPIHTVFALRLVLCLVIDTQMLKQ